MVALRPFAHDGAERIESAERVVPSTRQDLTKLTRNQREN
jgi:hypothetical protein